MDDNATMTTGNTGSVLVPALGGVHPGDEIRERIHKRHRKKDGKTDKKPEK